MCVSRDPGWISAHTHTHPHTPAHIIILAYEWADGHQHCMGALTLNKYFIKVWIGFKIILYFHIV